MYGRERKLDSLLMSSDKQDIEKYIEELNEALYTNELNPDTQPKYINKVIQYLELYLYDPLIRTDVERLIIDNRLLFTIESFSLLLDVLQESNVWIKRNFLEILSYMDENKWTKLKKVVLSNLKDQELKIIEEQIIKCTKHRPPPSLVVG